MKLFTILVYTISILSAKEMILDYKVDFGSLGSGWAKVTLNDSNSTYNIYLIAKPEGILASLTSDRIEHYKSSGFIKDSLYLPTTYIKSRENSEKTKQDTYKFNHTSKSINVKHERITKVDREESNETLNFFASQDILTLLFNIKHFLQPNSNQQQKIVAIGANKKDGEIEIIKKYDKDNNLTLDVSIKEKELDKLHIKLDKDYIPIEALLEDVTLFGDVKAILVNKAIK